MSQIKHLLRHYGKPVAGGALALFAISVAVSGRTVNGRVFDDVSPLVAATLSTTFGALLLSIYVGRSALWQVLRNRRPVCGVLRHVRRRVFGRAMRWQVISMAVGIAFMLPLTLLALDRLGSMGTVGAIVFCGPLWLAVWGLSQVLAGSRDWFTGLLWVLVAVIGVGCLTRFWEGDFDVLGLLFGAGAAAAYAVFLAMYDRMRETDRHALPMGVAVSNLLAAALMVALTGVTLAVLSANGTFVSGISLPGDDWMNWRVLMVTACSGLLSGALCQIAQNQIFRRGLISLGTFSIMTALEPAASFVLGAAMLSYEPGALDVVGTLLVVVAGIACFYHWEVHNGRKRDTRV
ncbi:hypothetical protein E1281_25290 [Actinomadura sp. KC345]|uniref:hypothetical protein n=1 Tax=Actinomadura sp. KC345 TaxID=2530371 RepID=UPI001046EDD3|nr:hypothetical protein [Actinomadura sp. KC345]TDC48061.1 hypothetical protein E1281_25290 [Actinomadura sp. KC345]